MVLCLTFFCSILQRLNISVEIGPKCHLRRSRYFCFIHCGETKRKGFFSKLKSKNVSEILRTLRTSLSTASSSLTKGVRKFSSMCDVTYGQYMSLDDEIQKLIVTFSKFNTIYVYVTINKWVLHYSVLDSIKSDL